MTDKPELPIYIDSSMLSAFKACPRKFYWSHIRKLAKSSTNVHLVAGSAIADSMDAIRKAQFQSSTPIPVDDLLAIAWPHFCKAYANWDDDPSHAKNFHNVLEALRTYLSEYHPASDNVQPLVLNGEPATEFTFAIPIEIDHPSGEPFIFCGRFDMLGVYKANQFNVIVDEKTTGQLGASWAQQWTLRGQFLGYIWACRKLGYNVSDVLVRGIGIYKRDCKILSVPNSYSDHIIHKWHSQMLNNVAMLRQFYLSDYWPYDFADACASYGGCPFVDLCSSSDPERWVDTYEHNDWSPISHVDHIR